MYKNEVRLHLSYTTFSKSDSGSFSFRNSSSPSSIPLRTFSFSILISSLCCTA